MPSDFANENVLTNRGILGSIIKAIDLYLYIVDAAEKIKAI